MPSADLTGSNWLRSIPAPPNTSEISKEALFARSLICSFSEYTPSLKLPNIVMMSSPAPPTTLLLPRLERTACRSPLSSLASISMFGLVASAKFSIVISWSPAIVTVSRLSPDNDFKMLAPSVVVIFRFLIFEV